MTMAAATMITPSSNEDDEGDKQNDNKDDDVNTTEIAEPLWLIAEPLWLINS